MQLIAGLRPFTQDVLRFPRRANAMQLFCKLSEMYECFPWVVLQAMKGHFPHSASGFHMWPFVTDCKQPMIGLAIRRRTYHQESRYFRRRYPMSGSQNVAWNAWFAANILPGERRRSMS
jgi:hypothetical protein